MTAVAGVLVRYLLALFDICCENVVVAVLLFRRKSVVPCDDQDDNLLVWLISHPDTPQWRAPRRIAGSGVAGMALLADRSKWTIVSFVVRCPLGPLLLHWSARCSYYDLNIFLCETRVPGEPTMAAASPIACAGDTSPCCRQGWRGFVVLSMSWERQYQR